MSEQLADGSVTEKAPGQLVVRFDKPQEIAGEIAIGAFVDRASPGTAYLKMRSGSVYRVEAANDGERHLLGSVRKIDPSGEEVDPDDLPADIARAVGTWTAENVLAQLGLEPHRPAHARLARVNRLVDKALIARPRLDNPRMHELEADLDLHLDDQPQLSAVAKTPSLKGAGSQSPERGM